VTARAQVVGWQLVPRGAGGAEPFVIVLVDTITQVMAAQLGPPPLHGIQFRAIRRPVQQSQVRRHFPSLGPVPAGAVQPQDHLPVGPGRFAPEPPRMVPVLRVDRGRQPGRGRSRLRVDRPPQVHPFVRGLLEGRRLRAGQAPAAGLGSLRADPGLLLEPDLDLAVGVLRGGGLDKRGACSTPCGLWAGSFLRGRGRGARQEKPSRGRRSYTPASVYSTPNSSRRMRRIILGPQGADPVAGGGTREKTLAERGVLLPRQLAGATRRSFGGSVSRP
jgi:hypothetical protein